MAKINEAHRYLVKENATGGYVGSTDNLGEHLELGLCLVDTIGADGLGSTRGNKGISAFLRAHKLGQRP